MFPNGGPAVSLKAALLACGFYGTRRNSCFPTPVGEVPEAGGSISTRGAALRSPHEMKATRREKLRLLRKAGARAQQRQTLQLLPLARLLQFSLRSLLTMQSDLGSTSPLRSAPHAPAPTHRGAPAPGSSSRRGHCVPWREPPSGQPVGKKI